jgi:hypothetical protein
MESILSTLSEIAANLMKRERGNQVVTPDLVLQDSLGWDELMPRNAMAGGGAQVVGNLSTGASHLTVLRLIQGGLA